jgi:pimeloyl-ACP methyl ester carboxylesterase
MGRIIDMPLPRMGETMDEGRIGQWFKKPGDRFRRGETLLEVESDKTTVEVPALQDGILVECLVSPDQMVPVESAIARIEIEGEAVAEVKKPASPAAAVTTAAAPAAERHVAMAPGHRPRASTAARAAARRSGVDLALLSGTGRNGRITRADLEAARRPARATYNVEAPHGKLFVREWPAHGTPRGSALLLHGLFSDSQSFITLGRKLATAGLRTLAIDLPGHGETSSAAISLADVVAAVAAAMPGHRLHLVGHSFGAVVATHLAERAASLTLLAPAGCGEDINEEFIAAMLGGHVDHALEILDEANMPPAVKQDLAGHLAVNHRQLHGIAAQLSAQGKQTVSILSRLKALNIPVTALFQRDDRVIPAEQALNLPPNVSVRFLPGASHLPHWRDPDLVARVVTAAT